jgi:hypothetical protein
VRRFAQLGYLGRLLGGDRRRRRVRRCVRRDLLRRAVQPRDQRPQEVQARRAAAAVAGLAGELGERDVPRAPRPGPPLAERHLVLRLERVLPGLERVVGLLHPLAVRRAHQRERVVVEAHERVQAVLLDALADEVVAPRRALAAEPPALLVDRHLEAFA